MSPVLRAQALVLTADQTVYRRPAASGTNFSRERTVRAVQRHSEVVEEQKGRKDD